MSEPDKINYVYIILTDKNTLYTGYTTDIIRRWEEHVTGKLGAKYTRGFRPVRLAACWLVSGGRSPALRIEASIKKLTRPQKEKLITSPDELTIPDGVECRIIQLPTIVIDSIMSSSAEAANYIELSIYKLLKLR